MRPIGDADASARPTAPMHDPDPARDLLPAAADALVRSLGDADDEAPRTVEALRAYVEAHVARLLDRRPALLMSVLYRVDVAERDVQRVLRASPPDRIAADLAALLLAREFEKIRLRRTHRPAD